VTLGLSRVERRTVIAAFDGLGALFGPVFAQVDAVDPPSRKDALMAICDMATAVSAISTNRCFPRAIIAWLSTYEVENPRKAPVKAHGTRWLSAISHVLTVRTRRGSPPVGDKRKGTPRNKRSDTARKKALRIRLQDEGM